MVGAHLRVVILVDADNIEIAGKDRPRRRIDYDRLLNKMNGRELVRAIYYRPNGPEFSGNYQSLLEEAGFEVKRTHKNSDAWFICDAIAFASKYDCVVFVGGDGDLQPVVPMLKALAVKVEVWGWDASTSERVKRMADEFVPLDRLGVEVTGNDDAGRSAA